MNHLKYSSHRYTLYKLAALWFVFLSLTIIQPMKDLVQVFKILNVCSDRVAGQDEEPLFEKIICDILKICSLPFLKEKSSDELVFEQIVTESVSQLGLWLYLFVLIVNLLIIIWFTKMVLFPKAVIYYCQYM